MMREHLVFYDGECGLCDHTVQFLLDIDKDYRFVFAPLQGQTARKLLVDFPDRDADSLILVENYQSPQERRFFIYGKAVFRILWLLGRGWKILGVLCFLPGWLTARAYQAVAKRRKNYFKAHACRVPDPSQRDRFLP
jgi:predicted DCC family thiol-disulfide oxidoreductase YuxK